MDRDDLPTRTIIAAVFVLSFVLGATIVVALTNSVPIDGTDEPVPIGAPNGMDVLVTGSADVDTGNPWVASDTVNLTTSKGSANFTGGSAVRSTVNADEITGTWTNVSQLTLASSSLTVDPADKPEFTVSGNADSVSARQGMAADDGTADFVYSGSGGTTSLTLNGLPANTQLGVVDRNTNTILDVASTDGSGSVTFSSLPDGTHTAELVTSKGGPNAVDATADPDGGVSTATPTLSIDIEDPDFPTGDNVTVEWYVDGSKVDTEYVQSNQTVTHTTSSLSSGDHTWHVELEDAYGQTDNSNTFNANIPENLSIRLETNPDKFAKNVTVEVTAYYSGDIQTRNVTDGNMSLTGFPVDEPIIIRMDAENYTTRTAVIESIFDQQSAYILNESVDTYLVRFDLRDPTGSYPPQDTVLFVERDLNQSGQVEWRTIAGDNFGVQGLPVRIKQNERYRLRIKNLETGDSAVIGAYTAIQSETVTVEAGAASIDAPGGNRSYGWSFTENETGQYILFEYNDTEDQTDEIKVTVHERFNDSNVLIDNQTFVSTNNLLYQIPMTADQVNKTWTAELYVDRGSGFVHYRVPISGGPQNILPDILDSVWITSVGVFIVLITGMAFSQLNQGVGAVTTSLVGGMLWWVGLLEGVTTGAAVVIAIAISAIFHFRQRGSV